MRARKTRGTCGTTARGTGNVEDFFEITIKTQAWVESCK